MRGHVSPFGKGAALVGGVTAGDKFVTVKRDRRVAVRSVACPTCEAAVGEPCVNAGGQASFQHVARRRIALRAEREAS